MRPTAGPVDGERPGATRAHRLAAHARVSTALSLCDDDRLRALVEAGTPLGEGIGGQTVLLDVDGVPVFVKQVRLTDLERRPENRRSTANLFGLPTCCHVGVGDPGGPGFGAWRELAAQVMASDWVVAGLADCFPLLHHWRVLPDAGRPLPAELADVDRAVAYWGGGPAVRERIEALAGSSAAVLLFLEYVPSTLHDWLDAQVREGGEVAERACAWVERELADAVSFMNGHGMLHLDVHFRNVLTDGSRLYVTDFGLAVSSRFTLDRAEVAFLDAYRDYDRSYTAAHLVSWLAVAVHGFPPAERRAVVEAWARGQEPDGFPPGVADLLRRHAPVAAVVGEFVRAFQQDSREAPYPAEVLDRLLDSAPVAGR